MFKNFALKRKLVKCKQANALNEERLVRAFELVEYLEKTSKDNIARNNQAFDEFEQMLKRVYKLLEGCGYNESSPIMEDIRRFITVD